MTQHHFTPDPTLQGDIRTFWTLEETAEEFNSSDIFPDSYMELIINCGAPIVYEEDGKILELPRVLLNPLQSKPARARAKGVAQLVSVSLYPWAVRSLIGTEPDLTNPYWIQDHRWLEMGDYVAESAQRGDYAEAIARLQEFVMETYRRNALDLSSGREAGKLLYATNGQMRVNELATHTYLSTSALERRFKYLTGVTPKTFSRLVRFQQVRNWLMFHQAARMADLASDFGYTDQAHLIHEFRAFAACTPSEFVNIFNLDPTAFPDAVSKFEHFSDNAEILQYG